MTMLSDPYAPLKLFGGLGLVLGAAATTIATGLVVLFVLFNPWTDGMAARGQEQRVREGQQVTNAPCSPEFLQGRDPRDVLSCPEYQAN